MLARVDLGASDLMVRLAASDGVRTHAHLAALLAPRADLRDMGDAVHAISAIHAHHPGLIAMTLARPGGAPAPDWLHHAAEAFAAERLMLARLTAAAGPRPSTPGDAQAAAALAAERQALGVLAGSERHGVALGAVLALLLDWPAIRLVLDRAADRLGIEAAAATLPDARAIVAMPVIGAPDRALGFGAQQLFGRHRGLFSLLEARASARAG